MDCRSLSAERCKISLLAKQACSISRDSTQENLEFSIQGKGYIGISHI